jgi:hypothetical protein
LIGEVKLCNLLSGSSRLIEQKAQTTNIRLCHLAKTVLFVLGKMKIIYIHGIGKQQPQSDLKRLWDNALFSHDLDVESCMAYWADILYPSCAARAHEGLPSEEEPTLVNTPWDEQIAALAPDTEPARDFARRLFQSISDSPLPDDADATPCDEMPGTAHAVKALPWQWMRKPVTWAITKLFIQDVAAYFYKQNVRSEIDRRLETVIPSEPRPFILISHSLGTVISYEVLHRLGGRIMVPVWITLGSPLGIDEVQDQIRKPLEVPLGVQQWLNYADGLDPVALDKRLANDFIPGDKVSDCRIQNAYRRDVSEGGPHAALGYLGNQLVHSAVREYLYEGR